MDSSSSPGARPRLLMVFHSTQRGGGERMGLHDLVALSSRFEITACAPPGPLLSSISLHCRVHPGLGIVPLWGAGPWTWAKAILRTIVDARQFARLLRRERIDLVMTSSATCLPAVLGARMARRNVIVRARDWPASRLSPLVFRAEAASTVAVLAVADALGAQFPGRSETVPDGVSFDDAVVTKRTDDPPLRLLQVGGIDPRKNQRLAIDVVDHLRRAGVEVDLTLVGRITHTAYAEQLQAEVRRRGLEDRVRFAGEVSSLDEIYAHTDVALSTATGEWTPLWLMEAAGRGIPAVAVATGAVTDIVVDGRTGLVADAAVEPLARAIADLAADPRLGQRLATNAIHHARSIYDLERTSERLVSVTQAVLERAGRAPGETSLRWIERLRVTAEVLSTVLSVRAKLGRRSLPQAVTELRDQAASTDTRVVDLSPFRASSIVDRFLRRIPGDGRCLTRSLVTVTMLARRGVPSVLVIGVTSPADFHGHAWVELAGKPLRWHGGTTYERLAEL